jgi:hypothetical protein
MTKRFVYSNFSKFSLSAFMAKVSSIQDLLSHPTFQTITPTPAEVLELLVQLRSLAHKTMSGNYLVRGERDQVREKIERMLDRQCYAVNALACGDFAILSISGFPVNRLRKTIPVPTTPVVKELSLTADRGCLELKLIGCKQARQYIIEVLKKDGTMAMRHVSTCLHTVISQLPVSMVLNMRVQAENSAGKSQWSPNLSFMIVESNGLSGLLQGYSKSNDKGMHAA